MFWTAWVWGFIEEKCFFLVWGSQTESKERVRWLDEGMGGMGVVIAHGQQGLWMLPVWTHTYVPTHTVWGLKSQSNFQARWLAAWCVFFPYWLAYKSSYPHSTPPSLHRFSYSHHFFFLLLLWHSWHPLALMSPILSSPIPLSILLSASVSLPGPVVGLLQWQRR